MGQTVHRNSPLQDIDEAYSHALPEFFCNYKYDYVNDKMTVYFPPTVNLEGAIYKSTVHNIYGKKVL